MTVLLLACGNVSDPDGSGGSGGTAGAINTGGQDAGSGASAGAGGGIPVKPPLEPTWEAWLDEYPVEGPHEDSREEAPVDYEPPIALGEAGWRDSVEPLCSSVTDVIEASIWADESGIALLSHAPPCNSHAGADPCGAHGSELWYNDGSGWVWLWGSTSQHKMSLTGIAGGDLLLGGPGVLTIGRDGELLGQTSEEDGLTRALTGAGGEAFAVLGGDPESGVPAQLHRFDGAEWTELGTLASDADIFWGVPDLELAVEPSVAYLGGLSGIYRSLDGDDFEAMPDMPVGEYVGISAIDSDSVWAANTAQQILHYDGESWTVIGEYVDSFHGFWNDGEEVYFVAERQFGRATTDSVEILEEAGTGFFRGITGVSSTEILVAFLDPTLVEYKCDSLLLLAHDGEEFHRF